MRIAPIDAREGRVLRLRLMLGFCDLNEIERWADKLIARLDDPPYELIELSLAHLNGTAALSVLVGDDETVDDMLIALASVDPERYDLIRLAEALERAKDLAIGLIAQTREWTREADLLGFGIDANGLLKALRQGKLTEEQVRKQMHDHFRQLRELAAARGATG